MHCPGRLPILDRGQLPHGPSCTVTETGERLVGVPGGRPPQYGDRELEAERRGTPSVL